MDATRGDEDDAIQIIEDKIKPMFEEIVDYFNAMDEETKTDIKELTSEVLGEDYENILFKHKDFESF